MEDSNLYSTNLYETLQTAGHGWYTNTNIYKVIGQRQELHVSVVSSDQLDWLVKKAGSQRIGSTDIQLFLPTNICLFFTINWVQQYLCKYPEVLARKQVLVTQMEPRDVPELAVKQMKDTAYQQVCFKDGYPGRIYASCFIHHAKLDITFIKL